jgi:hypothetical protein
MATTYRISIKYPDGSTMFVGTVLAEEMADNGAKERPATTDRPNQTLASR